MDDVRTRREALLAAMLDSDTAGAEEIVQDALRAGVDGPGVLDELIAPALHEVGARWERAEISVAEEHLATAVAQRLLVAVYPRLVTRAARSRERVLMAGAEGELHVIGLRMAADALEGAGFDVQFAGASLPRAALASAIRRHRPRLVGLGNTIALDAGRLREALEAIERVDPSLGVLLGGAGTSAVEPGGRIAVVGRIRDVVGAAERLLEASASTEAA